jgi:hypothetical protein
LSVAEILARRSTNAAHEKMALPGPSLLEVHVTGCLVMVISWSRLMVHWGGTPRALAAAKASVVRLLMNARSFCAGATSTCRLKRQSGPRSATKNRLSYRLLARLVDLWVPTAQTSPIMWQIQTKWGNFAAADRRRPEHARDQCAARRAMARDLGSQCDGACLA